MAIVSDRTGDGWGIAVRRNKKKGKIVVGAVDNRSPPTSDT